MIRKIVEGFNQHFTSEETEKYPWSTYNSNLSSNYSIAKLLVTPTSEN